MESAFPVLKVAGVATALAVLGAGLLAECRAHCSRAGATPAEVQERVDDHLAQVERKIDATEEQKAKIAALRDRLMPDLLRLHKSREAIAQELGALWAAPSLDVSAVDALTDKTVEDLRATAHRLAQGAAEFHAILTPEQRQGLAKLHARHCRD